MATLSVSTMKNLYASVILFVTDTDTLALLHLARSGMTAEPHEYRLYSYMSETMQDTISVGQLRQGLDALALGMDTMLTRLTALECEVRDIKAYVLTKLPESEPKHEG